MSVSSCTAQESGLSAVDRHEGVGVGIDEDAAALAADDAFDERRELFVLARERQIGPDLRGGVAQPHGVDVAGNDEGVGLAFEGAGKDGGVERVGEAVAEHQAQLGIGDVRANAGDGGLDGGAGEAALGGRGTLVQICGPNLREAQRRRNMALREKMARRGSSHSGDRCGAAQKCAAREASVWFMFFTMWSRCG